MSNANFIIAPSNLSIFSNSLSNDTLIYTNSSNMRLGNTVNTVAPLNITSNAIYTSNVNMGINNSNPQYPLDINGNMHSACNILIGNTANINSAGTLQVTTTTSSASSINIIQFDNIFNFPAGSGIPANKIRLFNSGTGSIFGFGIENGAQTYHAAGSHTFYTNVSSTAIYGTPGVILANTATSWSSASDERLKTIIEPISDSLTKINKLRNVIFRYNNDELDKRRVGVIAQDVQSVLPEAVTELPCSGHSEDYLHVQYTELVPLALAGIQELSAKVAELTAIIANLKNNT